jgi:hypothetical protein
MIDVGPSPVSTATYTGIARLKFGLAFHTNAAPRSRNAFSLEQITLLCSIWILNASEVLVLYVDPLTRDRGTFNRRAI